MRFLLTNDDGIAAPGLWAAAEALAQLGSVLIVAPANNHSGYGPAHPPSLAVSYTSYPVDDKSLPSVTAFALDATPAACAHVGLSGAFGQQPFDLVVSGVNAGLNVGRDVLYSGTVGAALTAQLLGVPAIAVSLDWWGTGAARWESARWALRQAIAMWRRGTEQTPIVFNVNVPNLPPAKLMGMRQTAFSTATFLGRYRFQPSPHGETAILAIRDDTRPHVQRNGAEAWDDAAAVAQGYVSLTPLRPFPDLLCVAPWVEVEGPMALAVLNRE